MNIPEDLKYSKEHEWIAVTDEKTDDGLQIGKIGVTDFAQGELGELVYVEVDTIGEDVEKDGVFGTLEAVKTTSDLFTPVTCRVLAFNPALDENEGDDPALINSDPYGEGWIAKVAILQPGELEDLMDASAYRAMVE